MMIIINDSLQFKEHRSTLPFFRFLEQGTLARKHINIPDDVLAKVVDVCRRQHVNVSKFIAGGIQLALDDARERFASEAANDILPDNERDAPSLLPAAPRPTLSLVTAETPVEGPVQTLQRHGSTWFDLVHLCDLLRVSPSALLAEIDEDDLLEHEGAPWIDKLGAQALLNITPPEMQVSNTAAWLASQI